MDGAGYFRRLFEIVLPLLFPVIGMAVLFATFFTFTDMDVVWILTSGGPPPNSTQVLATLAFLDSIEGGDLAKGAAVAIFFFPVLAGIAAIVLRLVKKAVERGEAEGSPRERGGHFTAEGIMKRKNAEARRTLRGAGPVHHLLRRALLRHADLHVQEQFRPDEPEQQPLLLHRAADPVDNLRFLFTQSLYPPFFSIPPWSA